MLHSQRLFAGTTCVSQYQTFTFKCAHAIWRVCLSLDQWCHVIGQGQHSSDTAVLESAAKAVISMRIMSRVWQPLKQNRGFSAKSRQISCSESRGYAGSLGDTRLLKPAAGFSNQFCTTVRGAALAGISFTIKTAFRFSGPSSQPLQ